MPAPAKMTISPVAIFSTRWSGATKSLSFRQNAQAQSAGWAGGDFPLADIGNFATSATERTPELPRVLATLLRQLTTPRRGPTRIALHAGAVAPECEVSAIAARLAFVAFGACFGAAFGGERLGVGAGVNLRHLLQRLRGRESLLGRGFQRCAAVDFGARGDGGEGRHFRGRCTFTPAFSLRGRRCAPAFA